MIRQHRTIPDASTFSIASGIWFVIDGLVSADIGGYIASRFSGRPSNATGGYHGLTTSWAVTTLIVLYLFDDLGGILIGKLIPSITSGSARFKSIVTLLRGLG